MNVLASPIYMLLNVMMYSYYASITVFIQLMACNEQTVALLKVFQNSLRTWCLLYMFE